MRLLVPAVAGATQPSGVCRHAANLVRCLLGRAEITKIRIVVGVWALAYFRTLIDSLDGRLEISVADVSNTAIARNDWYYRELPILASHFKADVVHTAYPVPLQRQQFPNSVVVTLHDLYPYDIPENFGYPRVLINRFVLQQSLQAADAIACVSQATLNGLRDRWPGLSEKAFRLYTCIEEHAAAEIAPLPELAQGPFLLAVAQHRRNKNLPLSLRVFKRLLEAGGSPGLKLLIIGNDGPETPRIRALIRELNLADQVITMNGLLDCELQWCYRNCELLLSTSTIEGFGLPIAEALLAGCRIVCPDLPVYREVSRDLCCFVPLGEGEVIAFTDAVITAMDSRKMRPLRLPQFSSDAVAADYLRLYQSVIAMKAAEQVQFSAPSMERLLPRGRFK